MLLECVFSAGMAAGLVLLFTGPLARWLRRARLHREVRVDTPATHQAKQGTPSMGGVVLWWALALGTLLSQPTHKSLLLLGVVLGFALLGLSDDVVKATNRPGFGLKARHKLAVQVGLSLLAAWALRTVFDLDSTVAVPLSAQAYSLGPLYLPLAVLVLVATANATNLTDGLDGLAAGVTFLCFAGFTVIALGQQALTVAVFGAACAGTTLAFLWFNRSPARIWMGDTGSQALGAALALCALALGQIVLLPIVGIILVVESLSVILQVAAFKTTGRRLFRMAPIHHAFELRGWTETRIVKTAWLVTAAGVLAALGLWGVGRAT